MSDMREILIDFQRTSDALFANACSAALDSIQNGSAVTGAPGQPVDTGALKASWQLVFEGADHATIGTNLVYALPIEDGVGPHGDLRLRSTVGGFHSVKQTVAGFPRLCEAEAAKAVR